MKSKEWYEKRLQKYFDECYEEYKETVEWYTNPANNKWKFIIPELELKVLLICDDHGTITEIHKYI